MISLGEFEPNVSMEELNAEETFLLLFHMDHFANNVDREINDPTIIPELREETHMIAAGTAYHTLSPRQTDQDDDVTMDESSVGESSSLLPRRSHIDSPDDYMVFNIFMCLFCCLPLGIYGLIQSCKVRRAIRRGNYNKARHLSKKAELVGIVSLVIGTVFSFGFLICWYSRSE